MRRCAGLLCVVLAACGGDDPTPVAPTASGARPVASIEIPADALDGPAQVTATPAEPARVPGRRSVGASWEIRVNGAEHTTFRRPVRLRVPFDTAKVPAGKGVFLVVREGGRWVPVPRCRVDGAFVVAPVRHLSEYQPVLRDEHISLVARWYGQWEQADDRGPEAHGPPTGMTTPSSLRRTAFVVAREEVLTYALGGTTTRFVVERAGVGIQLNAMNLVTKDGRVLRMRGAVHTAIVLDEAALALPPDAAALAALEEGYVELAQVEDELRAAEQAWEGAQDRVEAQMRVSAAQERLASVRDDVRGREFHLPRATSRLEGGEADGHAYAGASVQHPDFVYVHPTYAIEGVLVLQTQGPPRPVTLPLEMDFSVRVPVGRAMTETVESRDGNRVHRETASFYRVPVPASPATSDLRVAGSVYHRLLLARGEQPHNWFEASPDQTWSDLASRAIPVAGTAVLKAYLLEPGDDVEGGPLNFTRTAADGSFELRVPVLDDKTLRIELTWESSQAQLLETTRVDVPVWRLLRAAAALGEDGSTPLTEAVERRSTVRVRYAGGTRELDLGRSLRGASLRKRGGALSLEFHGLNALLVNTFCRSAHHLNQNLNTFVVYVDARADEVLACCPEALRQEVEARLAEETEDGQTPVPFDGSEICYPSSTLMALDSLQLRTFTPDAQGRTDQLEILAQHIYDTTAELQRTGGTPRVEWMDPPVSRADADRADALLASGDAPGAERILAGFRKIWPYGPFTFSREENNKKWLLTRRSPEYRPWQHTDLVEAALERAHPGMSVHLHGAGSGVERTDIDLFQSPDARDVLLRELGRGASGLGSIDHLTGRHGDAVHGVRPWVPARKPGGHLLALLGVVLRSDGAVARLLVHDPFGDLTQHPDLDGYYEPIPWPAASEVKDVDETEHRGAYAPYGSNDPRTDAIADTIYTKYYVILRPPGDAPSPTALRERLLPGDAR